MADMPQSWAAYEHLQEKLSNTTSVEHAAGLEGAMNIILQQGYSIEATTETDFLRAAESAKRKERYRAHLCRRYRDNLPTGESTVEAESGDDVRHGGLAPYGWSLDDNVHAQRELARLASQLPRRDLALLIDVAAGKSYKELAPQHDASCSALRTRVTRLRHALAA